jgi:hypothetical protein
LEKGRVRGEARRVVSTAGPEMRREEESWDAMVENELDYVCAGIWSRKNSS